MLRTANVCAVVMCIWFSGFPMSRGGNLGVDRLYAPPAFLLPPLPRRSLQPCLPDLFSHSSLRRHSFNGFFFVSIISPISLLLFPPLYFRLLFFGLLYPLLFLPPFVRILLSSPLPIVATDFLCIPLVHFWLHLHPPSVCFYAWIGQKHEANVRVVTVRQPQKVFLQSATNRQ